MVIAFPIVYVLGKYFFFYLFYRSENMGQKVAGKEPLPVEDSSNPNFKPLPEPSSLDSFDNKSNLSLLLLN